MIEFFRSLQFIIENGIIIITIFIFGSYVMLAAFLCNAMLKYISKNSYIDYKVLLSSPLAPSISIIAPAYNEGKTIIDNIRSLLSLHYNDFQVIIVNDGSKDESMEKIIAAYDLEKAIDFDRTKIKTKKIRGIYKSKNKAFSKLIRNRQGKRGKSRRIECRN
jgi:cellulose synthase/poly-beta-1,6-N-acetylglucosamine synthase-like glycosyltransferase